MKLQIHLEKWKRVVFSYFSSQPPVTHQMSFLRRSVLLSNALATRGKFSPRQGRRGAASAKRINFYKGKGGRREGRHTSKGKYVLDKSLQLDIVAPAPRPDGFALKPYVAQSTQPVDPAAPRYMED